MSFGGWPARITPDQEYYEDPEGSIYETSDSQTFVGYQTAQDHQMFLERIPSRTNDEKEDVKSDKSPLDGSWKKGVDVKLKLYDTAIAKHRRLYATAGHTLAKLSNILNGNVEQQKQLNARIEELRLRQEEINNTGHKTLQSHARSIAKLLNDDAEASGSESGGSNP